ncbi:multidrug transporter MATE [Petrotoga sp. 9T1HF07.CasAA.8.2]|uniref:MATE family efflux transporter n=1 Tax=unclassified Petrotoga TaxID=2620614 RepID=UPI000CB47138|nr:MULTISPECIES: MATE family efflux transporter [unclassified Petrotoga]MBL5981304.1 multidrug transporter MATE [Petrotoga sp. 8T1HF07.NaAc.6.1]PNR89242.1 multidrug transporter MATE [Petrotoga sp. 9T1HF07.CasAA.8.2]
MEKDLTKGSVIKHILLMALPTMFGMAAQMVYDLVDIFWIGMISSEAIAGVTIFSTIFWMVDSLNEIIGVSSISLVSQAYGKKDYNQTARSIEQTISFKFLVALIAATFMAVFLEPLMSLFADETVVNYGLEYGYLRLFFLPIMFSSYSVNTVFRCLGDANTPMIIMIFVSILNLFLDPIFIFETVPFINLPGLGFGVLGAAIATVVSQSIAFLIGFLILFSRTHEVKPRIKGLFRLNKDIDIKLITIGMPNGVEILFRNLSNIAILGFVSLFGNQAIAANGIAGRIFGFAFVPLFGLTMGASSVVGQAIGAGDIKRSERAANITGILGSVAMLFFIVMAFGFGESVISLFTNDAIVIKYGTEFLKYGSVGLVVLGYGYGLASAFSASGYNFPFLLSSIISRWGIQLCILIVAINIFNQPLTWVWLSYMFGDIAESFILFYFYQKGRWKEKKAW